MRCERKEPFWIVLALLLSLACGVVLTTAGRDVAYAQTRPDSGAREGRSLSRQQVSPERQRVLQQRFRRWQQMSPEQRAHLRQRFAAFKNLSPEQQDKLRQRWQAFEQLPAERKNRVRARLRRWKRLSPEQRRKWRKRFQRRRQRYRQEGRERFRRNLLDQDFSKEEVRPWQAREEQRTGEPQRMLRPRSSSGNAGARPSR